MWTVDKALDQLRSLSVPEDRAGMAHFGINIEKAFGIRVPQLRILAKEIGKDHMLALGLWESGYHEARILASMIADPKQVTPQMMDAWVADFNSWDVCDQACGNLFDRTPFVFDKIKEYAARQPEFEKRAAFALLAWTAVHDKKVTDDAFIELLPLIRTASTDERNFVKKAVNWALRQIGKRNLTLLQPALALAQELAASEDKTAQWIGKNAVKELTDPKQLERLKKKAKK